ncbi:CesT family type III secretion system chaperone [Lonsdalea quercina]|uniref:CesT family type III secretion system chaperone n=1 Tax=Lonsdalea quercina TaxID=71657 RepID=UPI0039747697
MLNEKFHVISRAIIQRYQPGELPPPPRPEEDIYQLVFDHDLHIHLIGSQPGYLNIVATFIAPHAWRTPEGFQTLLAENLFSLRHPAITLGYDSQSKKMVLYVRQPLDELSVEHAAKTFHDFLMRADSYCCGKSLPRANQSQETLSPPHAGLQPVSKKE